MVTKKRKAPAVRTRTVYRAKPRKRRASTGYDKIAPAMATAALVAVNASKIKTTANAITNNGLAPMGQWPSRALAGVTGSNKRVSDNFKGFVTGNALVTDAMALAGGYIGGEIIRKYAPTVIKKPLAKIAKKIPKVI